MIQWIWMMSCTQDQAGEVSEKSIPDKGPYLVSEERSEEPDIELLESMLQQAVNRVRLSSAAPFVDSFFMLMEESDEGCPAWYSNENDAYWLDSCTANSGTLFEGYGVYNTYIDLLDESGNQWSGKAVYSESRIESQSGSWLVSAGSASLLHGININNGADIFYSHLDQGFRSDTGELAPQLDMWASHLDDYKGIYFDVVLFDGESRVVFSQNQFSNQSDCPDGTQSVWTEQGWVQLLWDAQECSGCTDVFWEGESLGSVCIDFSDWTNWEENPWDLVLPESYE